MFKIPNPSSSENKIEKLKRELTKCRREIRSLKIYKERYKALFNQSLDAVFVMDLGGNIMDGNEKALEMAHCPGEVPDPE